MLEPRLEQTIYLTKIYFGDALHVLFRHQNVTGFQSWKDATCFQIEVQFTAGPPLNSHYDSEELWRKIIALYDKALTHIYYPSDGR